LATLLAESCRRSDAAVIPDTAIERIELMTRR
jgi:hypothetical protein